MNIMPSTTLSLLIDGDDLIWCAVRRSTLGARSSTGAKVEHFLGASSAVQSIALRSAPSAGRVVLTVPFDWCVLRPVPISIANWSGAREEITRSIESLVPIPQSEALIGLIGRMTKDDQPSASYLVVIDRSKLNPWTLAIESALGKPIDLVLAPHMSMLGLGLHDEDRVELVEVSQGGGHVVHRLQRGEVDELACAMSPESAQYTRYALGDGQPGDARVISSKQMAEGAALAPRVAPRHFVPLVGRIKQPAPRWIAPGIASLGAIACLLLASMTMNSRYEAAAQTIKTKQVALEEQLRPVLADQARIDQVAKLVEQDLATLTTHWRRVLPELEAAHRVLPEDAFLYRVQVDREALTIRGETSRASDVLERLESSELFSKARSIDAPVLVEERSAEQFHIKADRRSLSGEEAS